MQATKTAEAMAQPSIRGVISWVSQEKKLTEDEVPVYETHAEIFL